MTRAIRRFLSAMLPEHCATVLPWFAFAHGRAPMDRIHRLALAWQAQPSKTLATVLWPAASVFRAVKETRTHGPYVARHYGVPVWRQLVQQIALAHRHNIPSSSYYKFRLFEPAARAKARLFVHHHEIITLLPRLSRLTAHQLDKLDFFETCERHGLPTAPVLAVAHQGTLTWRSAPALPATDLIVKPTGLYGGQGVQRWRYRDGQWFDNGLRADGPALLEHFCARARTHRHILQRALTNHPDLIPLAAKGLCTVRVVTARQDGVARPVLAALRMPTGEACADNFHAGGVAAPVDLIEGTLFAPAVALERAGLVHHHPDSGAPIVGRLLPWWKETLDVCMVAHGHFPYPSIGWDVAITEAGPHLVEANLVWCADLVQMTNGVALGETAFPSVFLDTIDTREEGR